MTRLYDTDFFAWTQADALRRRSVNELDWDNLLEEVESLGSSQRRELRRRLRHLQSRLLNWFHQPDLRGTSWFFTIREQRRSITELLQENPSLKPAVSDLLDQAYPDAVSDAADQTGLPEIDFPSAPPFSFEDAMSVEVALDQDRSSTRSTKG